MGKKNYREQQAARPVVFIHTGDSFYLKYTTRQALNSCARVVLLGDGSNVHYVPEHYYQKDFENGKLEAFKKAYINMSWNNYDYVLGCYTRFFILEEFMERFGLEDIVMVDSDLMVYEDLSKYDFGAELAASFPPDQPGYGWACSPHVFYGTKGAVASFTGYMTELYGRHAKVLQEKWLYHASLGEGDIIDMTLLYLFIRQCPLKIRNLYSRCVNSDGTDGLFDHNYNIPQTGCRMLNRGGVKAVKFKDGLPYFESGDGPIRAFTIHLQGKAKYFIDSIAGKNRNSIFVLSHYMGRRAADILKKVFRAVLHKR